MPNGFHTNAASSPAVPDIGSAPSGDTSGRDQQIPGPLVPSRPSARGIASVMPPQSGTTELRLAASYLRTAGSTPPTAEESAAVQAAHAAVATYAARHGYTIVAYHHDVI